MKVELMISYSHRDYLSALIFKNALENMGFYVIMDEHEIPLGGQLVKSLEQLIVKCHYLLILITPNSYRSDWVRWEIEYCIWIEERYSITKIVPILLAGGQYLPTQIADRVFADFSSREAMKKSFRNLVWKLSRPNQGLNWQTAQTSLENQVLQYENNQQLNYEKINEEYFDDVSNHLQIKSPMVGTFYRSPGPDKPPFIKIGDMIEIGTRICIIEAMKLFNEIESEFKGEVSKILVEDASPVEYDQPMFLISLK